MLDKYTYKEFESLLKSTEPMVIQKAFLLANGMISVYGYTKEKAIEEALKIAEDWYENWKR